MHAIKRETALFTEARERFAEMSKQVAALRLLCGIDLSDALARTGENRSRMLRAIRRAIERERLKGMRGHPGYDLDRHIALKRSLDRLGAVRPCRSAAEKENGARRRRSHANSSF